MSMRQTVKKVNRLRGKPQKTKNKSGKTTFKTTENNKNKMESYALIVDFARSISYNVKRA